MIINCSDAPIIWLKMWAHTKFWSKFTSHYKSILDEKTDDLRILVWKKHNSAHIRSKKKVDSRKSRSSVETKLSRDRVVSSFRMSVHQYGENSTMYLHFFQPMTFHLTGMLFCDWLKCVLTNVSFMDRYTKTHWSRSKMLSLIISIHISIKIHQFVYIRHA